MTIATQFSIANRRIVQQASTENPKSLSFGRLESFTSQSRKDGQKKNFVRPAGRISLTTKKKVFYLFVGWAFLVQESSDVLSKVTERRTRAAIKKLFFLVKTLILHPNPALLLVVTVSFFLFSIIPRRKLASYTR